MGVEFYVKHGIKIATDTYSMIATSVTQILPLTKVRRVRSLPDSGRVLVHAGQKVGATDVIAECSLPGKHLLLDIRRALGIQRPSALQKVLERTVGEEVKKGDIIAQTGGMFSRVVRAPEDGVIVAIQRGQVLLEIPGGTYELKAGINGTVTDVIPEMGAVIESSGALLQGVWGNGRIDVGLLLVAAKSPEEELTRANLDITMRGSIVAGGHVTDADALQAAAELPLRGLILGSMTADLLPVASQMEIPVLLLEGFGRIPINPRAYKVLLGQVKRDVALNAGWDPERGETPEAFIPLPAEAEVIEAPSELKVGQTVKIVKPPHTSQIGELVAIRPNPTILPNKLRVPAGEVRLETNETVTVPLVNLTIIQ